MKMHLGKLAHVAAAGALVLGLSAFDGLRVGPDAAAAREAAAIPGTFNSSIIVANPSASQTANVSMTFVNNSGGSALSAPITFTVAPGSSVQKYVPSISGLVDGRYAVLIDSDIAVTAIANLASSSPSTSTSYNGISQSEVATSFNIPSVYRKYVGVYSTSIVIQNASTTAPANVTIAYKNSAGTTIATESKTIPTNASVTVDQEATPNLPDNFVGSATITSDQSIAAIFLIAGNTGSSNQLASARGIATGSTTVNLPVMYNDYFQGTWRTSALVQNVDTTDATVEVKYFQGGAQVGTQSATISPGSSQLFLQYAIGTRSAPVPTGFNGSAVVTSTNGKNIAVVANVLDRNGGHLEAYNGFAASSATARTTCASIFKNYSSFDIDTALTVQNVGSSATTATVKYYNSAGQEVASESTGSIAPGTTYFRYTPGVTSLANGFQGSAVVEGATGSQIIAVVNQIIANPSESGDTLLTYACANG